MSNSKVGLHALWIYLLLLVASSILFSFLLYLMGASIGCIVPAIVAVAAVVSRRKILLAAIPFVVFATLSILLVSERFSYSTA